jgi:hypothetical protein
VAELSLDIIPEKSIDANFIPPHVWTQNASGVSKTPPGVNLLGRICPDSTRFGRIWPDLAGFNQIFNRIDRVYLPHFGYGNAQVNPLTAFTFLILVTGMPR